MTNMNYREQGETPTTSCPGIHALWQCRHDASIQAGVGHGHLYGNSIASAHLDRRTPTLRSGIDRPCYEAVLRYHKFYRDLSIRYLLRLSLQ